MKGAKPFFVACLLAVCGVAAGGRRQAAADVPFTITASTGGASARLNATVTRNGETLPAAYVPFLKEGDLVRIDFGDYKRPHASWNYLVDVAFVSAEGKIVWLFPKDGPATRLFSNHGKAAPRQAGIEFTYGRNGYHGVPIVLIVPEDKGTGGLDSVRAYVESHPNDFITAAAGSEAAVDQQGWITNFLAAMQNGAINPFASQSYVESLSTSLGASPGAIQACYAPGANSAEVSNCVYGVVSALDVPTDYAANTVSGFFGSVLGSSAGFVPPLYSLAVKSALTVWSLFHKANHDSYEYLPSTLEMATPDRAGTGSMELLRTVAAPALRPPAALADVLFFSIGAADTAPPVIERDGTGDVCAAGAQIAIPLHLSHTSTYVHGAELQFEPGGDVSRSFALPLDARSTAGPLVSRAWMQRRGARDTSWLVRLHAYYGFDPLNQRIGNPLAIAIPHAATWTVIDRTSPAQQGKALDLIAMSSAVPCLSSVELRQGHATGIPMTIQPFGAGRVALHANLGDAFVAGPAQVAFVQDDPAFRSGAPQIVSSIPVRIGDTAPAVVTTGGAASAYAGDEAIGLTGSHFDAVDSLRLGGATYHKDPSSSSTSACFTGPPVPMPGTPGTTASAELMESGEIARVFPLIVRDPRPALDPPAVTPAGAVHISTTPLKVTLVSGNGPMPASVQVNLRRAPRIPRPCAGLFPSAQNERSVPAAAALPIGTNELQFTAAPEDVLGSDAFGTLQVQVEDTASKARSAWTDLPGTFLRAPSVVKIVCPENSAQCDLIGTELDTIDELVVPSGEPLKAPFPRCAADAQSSCIVVPRLQHYVVRSIDGAADIPLDDDLIKTSA